MPLFKAKKVRASRVRHFTPPPSLLYTLGQGHVDTPSRSAILTIKLFSQELGIPFP